MLVHLAQKQKFVVCLCLRTLVDAFSYLAYWLGTLFRSLWSRISHIIYCFPILISVLRAFKWKLILWEPSAHFLNCTTWFLERVAFCLKSLGLYPPPSGIEVQDAGSWGQKFSTSSKTHPLAVQFDRPLCTKVLAAFQLCPALLARIYSDTKMNLSSFMVPWSIVQC